MATTLHRFSINAPPRAAKALQLAMDLGGDNQTDTICRAIQIYAYLLHLMSEQEKEPGGPGQDIYVGQAGGEMTKVHLL